MTKSKSCPRLSAFAGAFYMGNSRRKVLCKGC